MSTAQFDNIESLDGGVLIPVRDLLTNKPEAINTTSIKDPGSFKFTLGQDIPASRTLLQRFSDEVYVKDFLAEGELDYSQAVLRAAATLGQVVFSAGVHNISANLDVVVPVTFKPGSAVHVDAGFTLGLHNSIESPRQWIFQGDGSYDLSHDHIHDSGEQARQVHASWFGAFPNPDMGEDQAPFIQKASDSMGNGRESSIKFDIGNYVMRQSVSLTRGCAILGEGTRRTVFKTDMDGFPLFTTANTACKLQDIQFEVNLGAINTRAYPWIELNHDACEVYNVNMGQTAKGIVCNANRYRIQNIYCVYGADQGPGSSIIECNASQGYISGVYAPTSAFGTESLVYLGPQASGTLGDIHIQQLSWILPATRGVTARAVGGNITRISIEDLQFGGFSNQQGAGELILLETTSGNNYTISEFLINGVQATTILPTVIRLQQDSNGGISQGVIDNVISYGVSTSPGIALIKNSGALDNITIGSGVKLDRYSTPVSRVGSPTRIKIDPSVYPNGNPATSWDFTMGDDQSVSVNLGRSVFTGMLLVTVGVSYGIYAVRLASSPTASTVASNGLFTSTTPLSGTSGTDGQITVGFTDGVVYLENRSGTSQRASISLLTGVS